MAAVTRALRWLLGSRLRIAGALGALAMISVALVLVRNDDHGGEQVDASAFDVRAGTSSTTTTARSERDGSTTTTVFVSRPRRPRVQITTERGRTTRSGRAVRPDSTRHARKAAPSRTPTTGAKPSPTTTAPPAPAATTTTTTPGPSTTTTTTPAPPVENGRIVFVDASAGGPTTRISVMDADGANATPLTDGIHVDADPAWSPDGSMIAFDRLEAGQRRVFVMTADGHDVHQVTDADGSGTNPTWSPDGSRLAFVAGGTDVAVVDLATGVASVIAHGTAEDAVVTWSPDGSLLAWAGPTGITVAAPDGSGVRQLTTGDDHDPAWSPDGGRLLVHRGDGVVIVDRAGSVSGVFAAGDGFADLEWSPDGQSFLYDCADGLCQRHLDGSSRSVLMATATDADWLAAPQESTTTTTTPSTSSSTTSTTTTSTTQP